MMLKYQKLPKKVHLIIVVNDPLSKKLRYVGMPITQCPSDATKNEICAGGIVGEGVCKGDSGGPLIVPSSTSDRTAVVIGIVSHGANGSLVDGLCAQNKPHVFASVLAQLPWIKKTAGIKDLPAVGIA